MRRAGKEEDGSVSSGGLDGNQGFRKATDENSLPDLDSTARRWMWWLDAQRGRPAGGNNRAEEKDLGAAERDDLSDHARATVVPAPIEFIPVTWAMPPYRYGRATARR
jgi:hypothetical protein